MLLLASESQDLWQQLGWMTACKLTLTVHVSVANITVTQYLMKYVTNAHNKIAKEKKNVI